MTSSKHKWKVSEAETWSTRRPVGQNAVGERGRARLPAGFPRPGLGSVCCILIAEACQWHILSRTVECYLNCFKNKQLVENRFKKSRVESRELEVAVAVAQAGGNGEMDSGSKDVEIVRRGDE